MNNVIDMQVLNEINTREAQEKFVNQMIQKKIRPIILIGMNIKENKPEFEIIVDERLTPNYVSMLLQQIAEQIKKIPQTMREVKTNVNT